MSRLPCLAGKHLVKALKKTGFEVIRVKGSHHFLHHSDGRSTVVPVYSGKTVGPGLLSRIFMDCELNQEQFICLL